MQQDDGSIGGDNVEDAKVVLATDTKFPQVTPGDLTNLREGQGRAEFGEAIEFTESTSLIRRREAFEKLLNGLSTALRLKELKRPGLHLVNPRPEPV
jgi:hypothetical protein